MNEEDLETNDLNQDVARCAFGDMLLDHDRNIRYKNGLCSIINEKNQLGCASNVVDIGTGSGLLSLVAASCGANHVTAIEMFKPVADIAEKIFEKNKLNHKIDLIKLRSTEFKNTQNFNKGNIIVAEVFDTELIGEGALRTFKEAHGSLVKKNSRVCPSSSRIWILPVQSLELKKFNSHPKVFNESKFLSSCNGLSTAFDFQMSQLVPGYDFQPLCKPFIAFRFNFEKPDSIIYTESFIHNFTVESSEYLSVETTTTFDCVFFWWDLDMDGKNNNYISLAPTWVDPTSVWRDHWMQAAYYLPKSISVKVGESVSLCCSHDEYTFWFDAFLPTEKILKYPFNNCLLHSICARSSFYRMNNLENENETFILSLQKFCTGKNVICLNEGSLIGFYAAKTAKFVSIIDNDNYFNQIIQSLTIELKLNNVNIFTTTNFMLDLNIINLMNSNNIVIISEPFYISSIFTIYYFIKLKNDILEIAKKFSNFNLIENFNCFIKTFRIKALSVKFDHLWKTVADIETALDFDLSQFNEFYQNARKKTDHYLEALPLWEYSSISTGDSLTVYEANLKKLLNDNFDHLEFIYYPKLKNTNAIILWTEVEYKNDLNNDPLILSTGLLKKCKVNNSPKWHRGYRQCVHFLSKNDYFIDTTKNGIKISFDFI